MGSWCLRAIAAALVILLGLAQSPSYAGSDAVFDEQETRAIGDLVREYIQKNPEIVLEALQELKSRQRLAEAETLRRQIEAKRDSLSNDPGSPIGGSPEGDVTVVEFFDYRCPYCKAMASGLARLLKEDGNIRFVYKEWPILGPVSEVAARAALGAWKQGRYAEYHEVLMTISGKLSEEDIFEAAKSLGLDIGRLRKDMNSPEIDEIILRNQKLADSLNISGTPAFVIGSTMVPGALEMADFKDLVQQARDGGEKTGFLGRSGATSRPTAGGQKPALTQGAAN